MLESIYRVLHPYRLGGISTAVAAIGMIVLLVVGAGAGYFAGMSSSTGTGATTTTTVTSTVQGGGGGAAVTSTVTSTVAATTVTVGATGSGTSQCTNPYAFTIQTYANPDSGELPFYVADQLGYFKQECLTLSKSVLLFGDAGVTALLANQITFQTAPDPSAVAFMRGADIKLLYTYYPGVSYGFLVARPGITNITQVKTIGSERQGTGTYAWITTMLQYYHVNATQVPFDTTTLRKAALVAGKVDAAPLVLSDFLALQFQNGTQYKPIIVNGGPVSPYSISIPAAASLSEGLVASSSFLSAHQDIARGVIRALIRAVGTIQSEPNATIPVIMKTFNYTRAQAQVMYQYDRQIYVTSYVNPQDNLVLYNTIPATTTWYNGVAQFNKVANPPDVSKFVDYSIYNSIVQNGLPSP